MAKHFKSKKIMRKNALIKLIIIIILIYFTIRFSVFILFKTKLYLYVYKTNKLDNYIDLLANKTINNPVVLLSYNHYQDRTLKKEKPVLNEEVVDEIIKPHVYIYNSHQTEGYLDNINVYDAAYMFKDALVLNNLDVTVENGNINEFLIANNMDYSYSYVASRYFIEENIYNNNYSLIIDLHRDALNREDSIINIDGKTYARILFVVGREHDNYQDNLNLANDLHQKISAKYPNLSRGVMLKSGPGVNGLYNQDLSLNMILLELGGNNNYKEEITNTINLLAPMLGEYLYGK